MLMLAANDYVEIASTIAVMGEDDRFDSSEPIQIAVSPFPSLPDISGQTDEVRNGSKGENDPKITIQVNGGEIPSIIKSIPDITISNGETDEGIELQERRESTPNNRHSGSRWNLSGPVLN